MKMKKISRSNKRIITTSILICTSLVIAAIWITALIATKDNGTVQESKASAETVERSLTGKNDDQNRKDVLSVSTQILNEALDSDLEFNERMNAIDKGDYSSVSKDLQDKMRFKDIFEDTKSLQSNTYQSLITLSTVVTMSSESEKVEPVSSDAWSAVYIDSEAGTAFVPMSIYSDTNSGFSLHFIYDESGWKLSPYSLIDSVKLSSNIQESAKAKTEE